jgi:hypothetical protein
VLQKLKQYFREDPSIPGNILSGIFQILLGLWLLLPAETFGPVLFADTVVFENLTEWMFGVFMVILGVLDIYFASRVMWRCLSWLSLVEACFWTFVTVGYVLSIPTSTNVVIFAFFALFNAYRYLFLMGHVSRNLRNKEIVGTI